MKIPSAKIAETAWAAVQFHFVVVTPELAADWLKHNRRNRRIKERQLEGYINDMRNGAWLTTHEGIAFDEDENLTDGQHRLEAIVRAKKAVLMLVSTGWPKTQGKKKTMDAVNMGANRSLTDQLHLQHDIEPKQAAMIVKICNAIAASAVGGSRIRRSTTDNILAIFALYKEEMTWLLAQPPVTQDGIKQSMVLACLVMARSVWPNETQDALGRLQTGENLTRENPLLHLRNWLMGTGNKEEASLVRQIVLTHLAAFKDKKSLPQVVVNSNASYIRMARLHKVRFEKICAFYANALPEFLREGEATVKAAANAAYNSEEAIRVGNSFTGSFSATDLRARTDAHVGQWLGLWLERNWIEGCGGNSFMRTKSFGK